MFVPKAVFATKGDGKHKEKLTSFEMALRGAKIAEHNLVKVSIIFPLNCKLIPRSAVISAAVLPSKKSHKRRKGYTKGNYFP